MQNHSFIQSFVSFSEAFGMIMSERQLNSGENYRFGFNGQEKVDEISGAGNHTTATFWEYDTRIGRRWNQDPKPNPSISNYATFAGNPIWFSDALGDTIRVDGFSQKKIIKDLGEGLATGKDENPFSFDKKGNLSLDSKKYNALSSDQKYVADVVKGVIESESVVTITKKGMFDEIPGVFVDNNSNKTVSMFHSNAAPATLGDFGGALTTSATDTGTDDFNNIKIYSTGREVAQAKATDGGMIRQLKSVVLYHEIAHSLDLIHNKAHKNTYRAVDIGNAVRNLMGETRQRAYDSYHHK